MKRREFLRKSCLFSGASSAAGFLSEGVESSLAASGGRVDARRVLVFIDLAGGCDGLNAVVPHGLDDYYRQRPNLAIPPADVLRLDHLVGFHPALEGFKRLFDAGKMAVVQGVGYPDPNRCHFRSRRIWHTARLGTAAEGGFPDRCSLPELGKQVMDGTLAENLAAVAETVAAETDIRLFYTSMGGFDTHAFQVVPGNPTRGIHAGLLSLLSGAVTAFLEDLTRRGRDQDVLVETFGTDHGTANPMFIIGKDVVPGLHGRRPRLSPYGLTPSGDLVHTVDFRNVYAGILPGWAGVEAGCVADPRLSLLRT